VPQLEAIFGENAAKGGRNIRNWGELGLPGSLADRAIQPYGWRTDVDFGLFFRERVLNGNHRWNGAMREFEHQARADGTQVDHGQRILDALAGDPAGIAISNTRYRNPDVRALPLAWQAGEAFVQPSPASLIDRSYPLVRIIPAYVDVPPGKPMNPASREFLRFLLSREGQRILIEHSGYLPLGEGFIARELEKLR
jgi:phosphate transport system substrate-binding protein